MTSLSSELINCVEFSDVNLCGVTVVGLGRICSEQKRYGPGTDYITDRIESAAYAIEAGLGSLAIYGQKFRHVKGHERLVGGKLCLKLVSQNLLKEEKMYCDEFSEANLPLREQPFGRQFSPHCTLGNVVNQAEMLNDPRSIKKLNNIVASAVGHNQAFILEPVRRFDQSTEGSMDMYMPAVNASNGFDGCWRRQTVAEAHALIRP